MKTFLITIACIFFAGGIFSSFEVSNEQKQFDLQHKRVDSMLVQVDKIDARLNKLAK